MKLNFEITQMIAEGSSPSVIHNSDNTVKLLLTDKEGLIQEYSTETPLGTWTDRTFLKVGRASGEVGAENVRMKNIPNYKSIYTWNLDDILRIAVSPDSIPLNTTDDPFRLFYAIDKEKLYMNIAQQWEYIGTKNHGSMDGLEEDHHPNYLTSERHELEPHIEIEDSIRVLKADVDRLKETPPGTTDLTNYYKKEQIDQLLANFSPSNKEEYINWVTVGTLISFNLATKELIRTDTTTGYISGGYLTTPIKKGISFKVSTFGIFRVGLTYDYTKNNSALDAEGRNIEYQIYLGSDGVLQVVEGTTKVHERTSWTTRELEYKIEVGEDRMVRFYYGEELLYTSLTPTTGAFLYPKCRLWGTSTLSEAKIY